MMKCKLCLSYHPKLIEAHIIPKSFYNRSANSPWGIHEERSPYRVIRVDKGILTSKKSPNGIYDPTIVCSECEKKFNQFDKHGYEVLSRSFLNKIIQHDLLTNQPLYLIEDVDFNKLKLFFLSMLWRAHASSKPLFSSVDLGTHEPILRSYILEGKTPLKDEYEVILFCRTNTNSDVGFQPQKCTIDGVDFYNFYIPPRFYALIKMDRKSLPKQYERFSLKETKLKQFCMILYDYGDSKEEQIAVENLFNYFRA